MSLSKKIVLLGHFGVGKTSVIRKFVDDQFSTDYKVSIGVHILKKEVEVNGEKVVLILWDTEGTNDIQSINKAYLLGAHGFVITYDVTRPSTYENLENQIKILNTNHPKAIIKTIGNKIDLLSANTIKNDNYDAIIAKTDYLTSAKTGENISTLFLDLAKTLTNE